MRGVSGSSARLTPPTNALWQACVRRAPTAQLPATSDEEHACRGIHIHKHKQLLIAMPGRMVGMDGTGRIKKMCAWPSS
eukprot:1140523-Pelagomonas_calceolata.AAC.4